MFSNKVKINEIIKKKLTLNFRIIITISWNHLTSSTSPIFWLHWFQNYARLSVFPDQQKSHNNNSIICLCPTHYVSLVSLQHYQQCKQLSHVAWWINLVTEFEFVIQMLTCNFVWIKKYAASSVAEKYIIYKVFYFFLICVRLCI